LLYVEDENEPPIFDENTRTFNILEENQIPTFIGRVKVKDGDVGKNGKFEVFLPEEENSYFYLDKNSNLYSNLTFDKEIQATYFLSIIARDFGNPSLTSTATVTINIEDKNEPPYFTNPIENGTLVEIKFDTLSDGRPLAWVSASDHDTGNNGKINFKILYESEENSCGKMFTVTVAEGKIYLNDPFNKTIQIRGLQCTLILKYEF